MNNFITTIVFIKGKGSITFYSHYCHGNVGEMKNKNTPENENVLLKLRHKLV
ncbi:hypothetical protein ETAE_3050 [Edwardsiella piscicida]|uniref:Uncharacterized protein n=2 Tax=Edwardsiella TaxID=635 RepID=A0AAU8P673_EDWPI|nr:hypothetical protein ETAE_3050 [Edwardsiella tarda EIB202]AIJ07728.1 Hypothetical protein ETEE_1271 [Edwardsiella anguillarum ET080813]GAJ65300.1 hypothetical protein HI13_contig00030-0003 [Edwardsiella piscicida]GAJ68595.1 hypothetical protein MA13_contig00011-0150 [Edwardsiella piscicida]GBK56240.1 hypothetical protein JFPO13_contig000034-0038 [Edwardsiella piscicida]